MRILVTGATGLLGRQLLPLIEEHEVVAITRDPERADRSGPVSWVVQDLTRPLDPGTLPRKLDAVVHLAQSKRYRDFPDGADDLFEVNVGSTSRLLQLARETRAERFVLASTGGVYAPAPEPIAEDTPIELAGAYPRSKRIAELLLDDYAEILSPIALRFFFIYGQGSGQTLIPRLADQISQGEPVVVEGDPGMRMNPVFAADAAAAIVASLGLDEPTTVNVAGPETVSVTELIEKLAAALGITAEITHTDQSRGDMVADTGRMESVLGISEGTKLDEGIAAVAAARAARPRRAGRGSPSRATS